jgi:tRNA(fMet)-specific endonuclease VapC
MSLYVLDTDVLTLLQHRQPAVCQQVSQHQQDIVAVSVISVQEMLTGWYALLNRVRQRDRLAIAYQSLADTTAFLGGLPILSFTEPAILRYEQLQSLRLNVGKMDLRIAAIALEYGAVVVTRNQRDFGRVPSLMIEDWTV